MTIMEVAMIKVKITVVVMVMIVLMLYTFLSPYSTPPPPTPPLSSLLSHYQTFQMIRLIAWYIPFPLMLDDDTFSSVFHPRLCRRTGMWLFSPPILWQPATMLPKIRKIKRIIFNYYLFRLRALSKSQNWPARPWPNQTFWQWNMLFPRGFAEKPSPLCIIFRIWLIWMVSFD